MNYFEQEIAILNKKALSIQRKTGIGFNSWCYDKNIRWKNMKSQTLEEVYKKYIKENDPKDEKGKLNLKVKMLLKEKDQLCKEIEYLRSVIYE